MLQALENMFQLIALLSMSLQGIQTQIDYYTLIFNDLTQIEFEGNSETYFRYRSIKSESFKNDENRYCRYRDNELLYPKSHDVWRWLTGGECFRYTDPARLNYILPLRYDRVNVNNVTYNYLVTKVNNITFPFDYLDERCMALIRPAFKTDRFVEKFTSCCKNAVICCENFMNEENIYPSEEYPCPALWDGWSCFPSARSGEIASIDCPDYAITSDDRACISLSGKQCFSNGTWNVDTDYLPCATAPIYRRRHRFHLDMLLTATILVTPAILILCAFRKLYNLRLSLHRNLMIAIVVKNIFTIIAKEVVIMDSLVPAAQSNNVLLNDGLGCRTLAVLENLSKNVIFMCMLADGFYLHKMVVRAFSPEPTLWILNAAVAGISIIPTLIWSILMGTSGKGLCWMVDPDSWYQWIPDGFKYIIMAINVFMLVDILRVLILKFGKRTKNKHTKQTVKAILVLLPIFGIPLLITSQRNIIDMNDCLAGDIFYYVSYTVEALQGITVSVIFCYLSKEVHGEIKNAYRKYSVIFRDRYGLRQPLKNTRRRTTATTNINVDIAVG